MKKKEFEIGEEFKCGLVKLRCEKATSGCSGCVFYREGEFNDCSHIALGKCDAYSRKDRQDVVFVEVED